MTWSFLFPINNSLSQLSAIDFPALPIWHSWQTRSNWGRHVTVPVKIYFVWGHLLLQDNWGEPFMKSSNLIERIFFLYKWWYYVHYSIPLHIHNIFIHQDMVWLKVISKNKEISKCVFELQLMCIIDRKCNLTICFREFKKKR